LNKGITFHSLPKLLEKLFRNHVPAVNDANVALPFEVQTTAILVSLMKTKITELGLSPVT